MDLSITAQELRQRKLYIATPMFGGMSFGSYNLQTIQLAQELTKAGITHTFNFLFDESMINAARAKLVHGFLKDPEWTHLLFWDADVVVSANDILFLLAADKDIIGAAYPKKVMEWESIRKAILQNPEIPASELEKVTGRFVVNYLEVGQYDMTELQEVRDLGTGMLMIKREVFERMRQGFPEAEYAMADDQQKNWGKKMWFFFDTGRFQNEPLYLSEDYMFCRRARHLGYKIWLAPFINTRHIGKYEYQGNMTAVAKHVREL